MNFKAFCALLIPALAMAGFCLWLRAAALREAESPRPLISLPASTPLPSNEDAAPREVIPFPLAMEQGRIQALFSGNGREQMLARLTNVEKASFRVQIEAGQMFVSGRNSVMVLSDEVVELAPLGFVQVFLTTVATRSTNKLSEAPYSFNSQRHAQLEPLLAYKRTHPGFSTAAAQTVALIVMENLPLSAVSKFKSSALEMKSRFNTDAFRVETGEILTALGVLRELGVPEASIAMTIDPQLKIEAMIDPLSHAEAMRYYGLNDRNEWEFWRNELLNGVPATRHYALYGIARFYPHVALEMLPRWAREPQTGAMHRLAAVQALAQTQRAEALAILYQLSEELGIETELGRAALGAAESLEQCLSRLQRAQTAGAPPGSVSSEL